MLVEDDLQESGQALAAEPDTRPVLKRWTLVF